MLVQDVHRGGRRRSAFLDFEVIRQNGSDSGKDSDVALEFEELVKKKLLKVRVELLFAHLHLLIASLYLLHFFDLLSLELLSHLYLFFQVLNLSFELSFGFSYLLQFRFLGF